MALAQGGQNAVLVGDEVPPVLHSRGVGRRVASGQDEEREGLIRLAGEGYGGMPRSRPPDPLDIKANSQIGEGGEHPFQQGAMPAIEDLAGTGRIGEAGAQQQECVPPAHPAACVPCAQVPPSILEAAITAWVRLSTPSFCRMAETCAFTVASDTPSS